MVSLWYPSRGAFNIGADPRLWTLHVDAGDGRALCDQRDLEPVHGVTADAAGAKRKRMCINCRFTQERVGE